MPRMAAFEPGDAGRHFPFIDERYGTIFTHCRRHARVKSVKVFAFARIHLQSMPAQGASQVKTGQILGRMTADGDVVVIQQQFHIQSACHGETGRLRIVALHLRAIRTKNKHHLVRIGHGNAIGEGPQVAKPSGGEFDAQFRVQFRVAVETASGRAVIEQAAQRHITVKGREGVLQCHPVPALVKMDRVKAMRSFHECIGDKRFGNDAECAAGVAAQAASACHRGKKDNGVPHDLDIGQ